MDTWFTEALQVWYHQNKRILPWREEKDAYKIWLSEIILQQTQVAQGLAYYHTFTERFPTVFELAAASEDEILRCWQGLGYYSRARNLHAAARSIVAELGGKFPDTYGQILQLKGVGEYTAAAIASFAYDQPFPVVDGNVYRLLSRLFGISTPIDSGQGKKEFLALAGRLLDRTNPAIHNQAIMELGSQICRPTGPCCQNCPLTEKCFAHANLLTQDFPVKAKKIKVRPRFFNYIVVADAENNVYLKKRTDKDIWEGLYEFLLLEKDRLLEVTEILSGINNGKHKKRLPEVLSVSPVLHHLLTHQKITARFHVIRMHGFALPPGYIKCSVKKLDDFAFPRLITRFMQDCGLKEML